MDRDGRPPGACPDTGGLTVESRRESPRPLLPAGEGRPDVTCGGISQESCPNGEPFVIEKNKQATLNDNAPLAEGTTARDLAEIRAVLPGPGWKATTVLDPEYLWIAVGRWTVRPGVSPGRPASFEWRLTIHQGTARTPA